jgi:hypothetical protein
MFGTIRKHQKWLWLVIITLTIASFLVFFSPYSRMNGSGRGGYSNRGSINGERISEQDFEHAVNDVKLRYFFFMSGGRWPDATAEKELEDETYKWLLLLQKERQLGIHIGTDEAVSAAQRLMGQLFERAGSAPSADIFVKQILEPHGITLEDFERFCRNQLALQELMGTVAVGGKLITPAEAKEFYIRNQQDVAAEAVFFTVSNYISQVTVAPDALKQFYTNRMVAYRIPDRVQVRYAEFNVSNFLAQAETELKTNLTQNVDAALEQLGTNYLQFGKTTNEARAKVREEFIHRQAMLDAGNQAKRLAAQLNDNSTNTQQLNTEAQKMGVTVKTTAPFDHDNGPKEFEVGADFARAAFSLSPEEPFAQPIVGRNGVYVIAFEKQLPSENPAYAQVADKVTSDYKFLQALQMAYQAGESFYTSLTNGFAQGKSFASICLSNNVKPVALPPFSADNYSHALADYSDRTDLEYLKQTAAFTPVNKASAFVWPKTDVLRRLSNPGGFILFVKAKLPVDEGKMIAELPKFTDRLRRERSQEAFNFWFGRELQKGMQDTPLMQQRQPAMAGGARG